MNVPYASCLTNIKAHSSRRLCRLRHCVQEIERIWFVSWLRKIFDWKNHTHTVFFVGKPENKSFAIVVLNSSRGRQHTYLSCCCTQYTTPTWTKRIERKTLIFFISSFVCDFSSWIFFSISTFVWAQHLRLLGGLRIIYQLSLSKLREKENWNGTRAAQTTTSCHDEERTSREQKKSWKSNKITRSTWCSIFHVKKKSDGFFLI